MKTFRERLQEIVAGDSTPHRQALADSLISDYRQVSSNPIADDPPIVEESQTDQRGRLRQEAEALTEPSAAAVEDGAGNQEPATGDPSTPVGKSKLPAKPK